MVVVLAVIAMVSGAVLTQVYNYTYEIIQANLVRELEESVAEVLPNTVSMEILAGSAELLADNGPDDEDSILVLEGYDEDGSLLGFAYVTQSPGYGGPVKVLVGVSLEPYEILGVKVLDHAETPGLGTRIEEVSFREQFVGKTLDDPIELSNDIDSLTGATVSAAGVVNAVRDGLPRAIRTYEGRR